jgi:hypothetical protein
MSHKVITFHNGGPSHLWHLVLTALTCGLWLPIWALVVAADMLQRRPQITVHTERPAPPPRP